MAIRNPSSVCHARWLTAIVLYSLTGCSPESSWTSAGTFFEGRAHHSATLLENDQVLFAGGRDTTFRTNAELRDTLTGRWSLTDSMITSRAEHTATRLDDGRVVLSGGTNEGGSLASVEAYDPMTQSFSALAPMNEKRTQHTASWTLGKVVVLGGWRDKPNSASATFELYDVAMDVWSSPTNMPEPRAEHTATLLDDGTILVVGGTNGSATVGHASRYDARTNTWLDAGTMAVARQGHTATRLDATRVLIAGGTNENGAIASAELYDVVTNSWLPAASMGEARHAHTATRLNDGTVLIAGGEDANGGALETVERYCPARSDPDKPSSTSGSCPERLDLRQDAFVAVDSMSVPRTGHTATWLADGSVLVAGGDGSAASTHVDQFVPEDNRIFCERSEECPLAMVCNAEAQRCEHATKALGSESACAYTPASDHAPARGWWFLVGASGLIMLLRRTRRARSAAPLRCPSFGRLDFAAHAVPRTRPLRGLKQRGPTAALQNRATPKASRYAIRRRTLTSLLGSGLLLLPGLAEAQTSTFYLDRLQMAGGPNDGVAVWRPVFGPTRLFGQLALGYARDPLRVESFVTDSTKIRGLAGAAEHLQISGYATAGVELLKRGAIAVTIPYVVMQRGYRTDNLAVGLNESVSMSPSALGDLRIDGRVLLLWNESRSFSMAARASFFLPTGDEFSFTGERSAWGNVGASAEAHADAFFVTTNLGLTVRPTSMLVDLQVGTEFVYAAGVYVPLMTDRVRIGAELFGSVGLTSAASAQREPIEAALSSRVALGSGRLIYLGASAGARIGHGYAPDMRFVARIGGVFPLEREDQDIPLPVHVEAMREEDSDGDGFVDVDDPCPVIAEDHQGAEDGCATPPAPVDIDNDGLMGPADRCPSVAEDKDGLADDDGCPEDDFDGDGMADVLDKCPKEPGVHAKDPANEGCPAFLRRTGTEVKLLVQIEFEFSSTKIAASSFPILDELARLMAANPDIEHLRIEGHTDNAGSESFNKTVSTRRAEAVRDYLVQRGKVNSTRLSFEGFGPSRPIAPNNTDAGRAKNRRVELHIEKATGGKGP